MKIHSLLSIMLILGALFLTGCKTPNVPYVPFVEVEQHAEELAGK